MPKETQEPVIEEVMKAAFFRSGIFQSTLTLEVSSATTAIVKQVYCVATVLLQQRTVLHTPQLVSTFHWGSASRAVSSLTSTVNTGHWLFMGVSMSHSVPHTTDVALFAVSASLTMDLLRTHSPFAASSAPVQASCHGCSTTYCLPMVH